MSGASPARTFETATFAAIDLHIPSVAKANGIASKYYLRFGVDAVEEMVKLCRQAQLEFANIGFFASKLVFAHETWITRLLHNQIVLAMQRRLQFEGIQMVILPMRPSG